MHLPSLSHLLAYENKPLIEYHCHYAASLSTHTATQQFKDLLRWMWLNVFRQQKNVSTYLFGPLLPLDALWHTFILHTFDYMHFCQTYFDEYFHHHVELPGFEHVLQPEELGDFLNDAFLQLGEDWVLRYFSQCLI